MIEDEKEFRKIEKRLNRKLLWPWYLSSVVFIALYAGLWDLFIGWPFR